MTTETDGAARGGTARRPGGPPGRWRPGDQILWRYRTNNGPGFSVCRPVTVVQDSPGLLAVWLAPGTECVRPAFADGSRLDDEPLATRYTRPRTTIRAPWTGMGVLKLAEPGRPWSVWLFWERHWRFKNWYVNLEAPRDRWAGGVDSEDHFLDIAVYPDRSWEWLDEDEFAQAREAGLLDAGQARRVRAAAEDAARLIGSWGPPFSQDWPRWRPDPAWPVPALPRDWDRPQSVTGPPQRTRTS
ncbi:DUF402 domain-containing protein [Streptomyces sp. 7-21]|uniref:cytidylyl-2-hydroxypropylphosphonate hydrolase n=1 Tax=Streptomyces sp. 7-21 TaxID=2802283 RepID=UPI00191CA8E9|nr:DUF402 domain-containing protein [Streptomyces sp. 7-21]MBL1065826.1 DUF402 domain-containing protein [Streptomyces sp. 7-21]